MWRGWNWLLILKGIEVKLDNQFDNVEKKINCWLQNDFSGIEAMVRQAREWESSGEYARAVECYLKVTTNLTDDRNVLEKCWMKV